MLHRVPLIFLSVFILSCSKEKSKPSSDKVPVVTSLLGVSFYEPERTPQQQAKLDSSLNAAKEKFNADPSEENYIWYGRREGYLIHIDEAIRIFTEGLEKYPDSYRLLRHRGHRYISARKFDEAIRDLERAAEIMPETPLEVEADGQPNKLNIPLSTTQFNVWYHLGLAYYLKGNFAKAEEAYLKCLATSENDDSKIAVLDWLYMINRRQGKPEEANALLSQVSDSMTVIENDSYFTRLKMYKGWIRPDEVLKPEETSADYDLSLATQGYGVGNWYYYNGDTAKADNIFRQIVNGKLFTAFGFIAAEAEVASQTPAENREE